MQELDRRSMLLGAAGVVAASMLPAAATAQGGDWFYGHGLVWNRTLPGLLGELRLTFDVHTKAGGTGFGTLSDALHPEFNAHFAIRSTTKHGNVVTMEGEVVAANDPRNLGQLVRLVGVMYEDATDVTATLGPVTFFGAGIGLLVPAVQKVREAASR